MKSELKVKPLHRAARKFQTVLAAAELEREWVQSAFGTKVTTWESSDGYHRARLPVPKLVEWEEKFTISSSVFSPSREGAELYTEVFVLSFYLAAPWTPLAEHRAAAARHPSLPPSWLVFFWQLLPWTPQQGQIWFLSALWCAQLTSKLFKNPFSNHLFFPCLTSCPWPPDLPVPSTQVSSTKPVCWIFQFVTQQRLFWAVCWEIPDIVVQIILSRLIGTPHWGLFRIDLGNQNCSMLEEIYVHV